MKSKKILLIKPLSNPGAPAYERFASFHKFFQELGFEVLTSACPSDLLSKFLVVLKIVRFRPNYVFVTMPPFRNWYLFFIPFVKVILDIRDGWSIAMLSGYGGKSKPSKLKSKLARFIEYVSIKRSFFAITCTPGLQEYLQKLTDKNIHLIRNGVSSEDLIQAKKFKAKAPLNMQANVRKFICAGKFSEYGKDKVIKVVSTIDKRYGDKCCLIQLVGCEFEDNKWLNKYLADEYLGRIKVEFIERLSKEDLYKLLSEAFCAVTIIRDPSYEFGTKIYDYIAIGLPFLNYFDNEKNSFIDFFGAWSDVNFIQDHMVIERKAIVEMLQENFS